MNTRALVVTWCLCLAACGPDSRRGDDGVGSGDDVDANEQTVPFDPNILMLDFRSGWWAGSAGDFHRTVLDPLRNAANNITIEFHHGGSDVSASTRRTRRRIARRPR